MGSHPLGFDHMGIFAERRHVRPESQSSSSCAGKTRYICHGVISKRHCSQKSCAEVLFLIISISFVLNEISDGSLLMPIVIFSGASIIFTAGALRVLLSPNGVCPWRWASGPLQFTWYRIFIGWGLGTVLYLLHDRARSFFVPSFILEYPLLAVDLLLIVEPTFFGKWGGRCLRTIQEYTMPMNGCIFWAVRFHLVYSVGWWTSYMLLFMIASVD